MTILNQYIAFVIYISSSEYCSNHFTCNYPPCIKKICGGYRNQVLSSVYLFVQADISHISQTMPLFFSNFTHLFPTSVTCVQPGFQNIKFKMSFYRAILHKNGTNTVRQAQYLLNILFWNFTHLFLTSVPCFQLSFRKL